MIEKQLLKWLVTSFLGRNRYQINSCMRIKNPPSKSPGQKKGGHLGRLELAKKSYLAVFSFSSIRSSGIAPGTRSPSAKKIVGVPVIFNLLANSRFLSTAVVSQSSLPVGALPSTIQSFHDLERSLAHQIWRDFLSESSDKIGNRKGQSAKRPSTN